jgi:hypothetical protein
VGVVTAAAESAAAAAAARSANASGGRVGASDGGLRAKAQSWAMAATAVTVGINGRPSVVAMVAGVRRAPPGATARGPPPPSLVDLRIVEMAAIE